ncbi:S1 family peptidase [Limnofasciculus baicalensis]|uniref:Serine protease n=1 Tax=Limnofasciculus baicalensis BBK-W-15 TaxID=2699891 RepID=A0AAE3KQ51_9CYAN|nr:serine protease [Limnofasciculus baicalensis]MCP2732074.1 serine protease [Limnofasciculus baicalensis BBK-W-15]
MARWKFPGIIASLAVAVILSQSSCGFQKSPSEIAKEITVLIDSCSVGSGVIFKHENNRYFVMTARHVVSKDVDCFVITSDKERYTAKKNKFTYYQGLDLAVIEFESDKSYPVEKLGKSEAVTIGKNIYVAGAPLPNETLPKRAIQVRDGKIISTATEGELGYTLVDVLPQRFRYPSRNSLFQKL